MRTQIITIILTLGALLGIVIGATALHGSGAIAMTKEAAGALVGVSSLMFIWCIKSLQSLRQIKKSLCTHYLIKRAGGALGPGRPQSARGDGASVGEPSHDVHDIINPTYTHDPLDTDEEGSTTR